MTSVRWRRALLAVPMAFGFGASAAPADACDVLAGAPNGAADVAATAHASHHAMTHDAVPRDHSTRAPHHPAHDAGTATSDHGDAPAGHDLPQCCLGMSACSWDLRASEMPIADEVSVASALVTHAAERIHHDASAPEPPPPRA